VARSLKSPTWIGVALLAFSINTARAQTPLARLGPDTSRVVFVCEHGTVKSLVAMSYFNRGAEELHLPYRAIARGTNPDSTVPPVVREGLKNAGFDLSRFAPHRFTARDLDGAGLVVSFDQDISAVVNGRVAHRKWDGLPAVSENFGAGRDAIAVRIDSLLRHLAERRQGRVDKD
jgi:protein-tyrosine-phosphatase